MLENAKSQSKNQDLRKVIERIGRRNFEGLCVEVCDKTKLTNGGMEVMSANNIPSN